jgi:hypothetical protein
VIRDKLRNIVNNADNESESSSDYDGAFSYKGETHQFAAGAYDGVTSITRRRDRDTHGEGHYYEGGYVLGSFLQFMIVSATAVLVYLLFW